MLTILWYHFDHDIKLSVRLFIHFQDSGFEEETMIDEKTKSYEIIDEIIYVYYDAGEEELKDENKEETLVDSKLICQGLLSLFD